MLRYLAAGALVVLLGAVLELLGKTFYPPLRMAGVVIGLVGVTVFFVAGIWYLTRYIGQFLP
ncbi:MAG: hypothetical protein ABEH90_05750 [Halolamina sp.]